MSTKSTIFLTKDNEHCYSDCAYPHYKRSPLISEHNPRFIGYSIFLEMSLKNIEICSLDEEDLIIEIKPGSELYNIIKNINQ